MNAERMSFDDACRELGVTEAELEQLVAAGEIASIKEGDTLFFKREVIRKFKKSRESEPTILLADEEVSLLDGEEIDLLQADDDEGTTPTKKDAASTPKRATEPMEISLDDDVGLADLDLEEDVAALPVQKGPSRRKPAGKPSMEAGDETLLNLDGLLEDDSEATTPVPSVDDSTLLDTDLLDLGGEGDPFSSDTVEETSADVTEQGTLLRGGGARVMQMKRKSSHAAWTVALALSCLILILPLGVLMSLMFAQSEASKTGSPAATSWVKKFNILEGPVEAMADMFRSNR